MVKQVSESQMIGTRGETHVAGLFLSNNFIFRPVNTLDTGVDGTAEPLHRQQPMGIKLNVQIKTTDKGRYNRETSNAFSYLLKTDDLDYWMQHPEPVVIVLHRLSDQSTYWKSVDLGQGDGNRTLEFDKNIDVLNEGSREQLLKLCTEKRGLGSFVPPTEHSETAIVNMFPIKLPDEMFVATSPYPNMRKAGYYLGQEGKYRGDWILANSTGAFWSFHDPRKCATSSIVDMDQVECIDTVLISESDDLQTRNDFAFLLRRCFQEQYWNELDVNFDTRTSYFRPSETGQPVRFRYRSFDNATSSTVVMVQPADEETGRKGYMRHHAIETRFELVGDEWCMLITPTYVFTSDGYRPKPYAETLLSGKKRMDSNATVRGQIIMWQRFLRREKVEGPTMFDEPAPAHHLKFGEAPVVELALQVPEDAWGEREIEDDPGIGALKDTLFDVD